MSHQERDFQLKAYKTLSEEQSALILAPTGLGKTRAALEPFIKGCNPILTTRFIYALPLRALCKGVVDEVKELNPSARPVVHHGDEPESQFFSERIVVTTVDQYFTAFAGAPLSWASHLSHAAAGSVLTSYSVFDEVHLLSPQRGLQLLFGILRIRHRWGLLSCVMTATLPPSAVKFLEDFCGLEKIEASQKDVQQRDGWRKVLLQLVGSWTSTSARKGKKTKAFQWEEMDPEKLCKIVREKWNDWQKLEIDGPKKIIVFVNTVDRAILVYRGLKEANFCPHVFLAHSRFTKDDQREVERKIHEFFGRNAKPCEAILVTTQVSEAGLNISAPLVITELCPMDSLIQRVGRCQRFKGKSDKEKHGRVLVVKPKVEERAKWYSPYQDSVRVQKTRREREPKDIPVAEITRIVLEEQSDTLGIICLNWGKEKELVEQALDDAYRAFLSGSDHIAFEEIKDRPLGRLYQQFGGEGDGEE